MLVLAKNWPGLRSLLMLLLATLITSESTRGETEVPVFSDGFEALESPVLDCVREGYPCSLADADPDALDRSIALLQKI